MSLWALEQSDCKTVTKASSPLANPPQAKSPLSWGGFSPWHSLAPANGKGTWGQGTKATVGASIPFPFSMRKRMDEWLVGQMTDWQMDGQTEKWMKRFMDGWVSCLWIVILLSNYGKRSSWLRMYLVFAHFAHVTGPGFVAVVLVPWPSGALAWVGLGLTGWISVQEGAWGTDGA